MTDDEQLVADLKDEKRILLVLAPDVSRANWLRKALGRTEVTAIYVNDDKQIDFRSPRTHCVVRMPGWDLRRGSGKINRAVDRFNDRA